METTSDNHVYPTKSTTEIHTVITTEEESTTRVSAPARVTLAKPKNVKKKKVKLTWKKVTGAKGYQIQYARNKKFTKSLKTVSTTATKKTVKKLQKKKKYYFRVRAYKVAGTGNIYGDFYQRKLCTWVNIYVS